VSGTLALRRQKIAALLRLHPEVIVGIAALPIGGRPV